MPKRTPAKPRRDRVQISVVLPADAVQMLRALAAQDHRNRSNWIEVAIRRAHQQSQEAAA
jgi:metal-responsive CopG/Arc/MetJ family transcriptional regulator